MVLFVLASEEDLLSRPESFNYKDYSYLYWRLSGYEESSIRGSVLQLVATGEVDKIVRNNTPLYRLTSQGRDRLMSLFPISIGQKRVWDRIWRIALIKGVSGSSLRIKGSSAKKKERESRLGCLTDLREIRRGLRGLGFKKLSSSVYITPMPVSVKIKEFCLKNKFINAQIAVIESRRLLIGDDKQIAKNIWDLERINALYHEFIRNVNKLLKVFRQKKVLSVREKKQFSLILSTYFSLLKQDPGLPKRLLEADWPADLAQTQFLKLVGKVSELEAGLKK